ncbi:tetratricopeptide repeat protein [Nonomuraea sp. NPDC050310]|uniref:tetratricopeptide repeat protein n=1 Tax=Nonomuraea sp. NPDC050310 TaxID=3154935 RepID=UPI00340E4BB1
MQTGDGAHAILQAPRPPLPKAASVQAPPGLIHLPRRSAVQFVGRDHALEQVRAHLAAGPATGVITQAVVGLGGIGKSELALQHARRHQQDYLLVWWIDADSPEQIQAGLAALGRALATPVDSVAAAQATAEEAAAWTLAWLAHHPGWLIVFDNVEEIAHVEPYLADLSRGFLLITTRRDAGWERLQAAPIRLELLPRADSVHLLAELISPAAVGDAEGLETLAEQMGDLPLALTQAGAYIARTPRVTLRRYLKLLADMPERMYQAAPMDGDAERVIAKVWALSQARIQKVSPLAADLLNLLAFFAPDNLPCQVLAGSSDIDELQVDEALALLASYSLITVTTQDLPDTRESADDEPAAESYDVISVHRLVQAVTRHQLDPSQCTRLKDQAADLLLKALPAEPEDPATWPLYQHLLPHARTVLPLDSPGLSQILTYLLQIDDRSQARQLAEQVTAHLRDDTHPCALHARHVLAHCTGADGNAAAARDQLAELLPVRERVLGAEHPSVLTTRHNLAYWTGRAGDAAAARDLFADLLPVEERVRGAEHSSVLTTRHILAYWTGQAGDAAAALNQLADLLPVQERVLGAEHPDVLATRHNLAYGTGQAGDAAAARDQLAELLPVLERVRGAEHPHVLTTRHNLAYWTGQAGDAAAALNQLAELLPVQERVLGAEHPHVLATRHDLAYGTGQAGDAAAARDQFAELLPMRERVLGAEHPDVLTTRHILAYWTGQAGDAAAARDQLADLLPVQERVLGAEHPHVLATRHNLAYGTGQAGDAAAALNQLADLLPVQERVLGAEHPHVLATRHSLAYWTGQAGDAAAARDQFADLLPVRERVLGAEHPDVLATRHNLARWTERLA